MNKTTNKNNKPTYGVPDISVYMRPLAKSLNQPVIVGLPKDRYIFSIHPDDTMGDNIVYLFPSAQDGVTYLVHPDIAYEIVDESPLLSRAKLYRGIYMKDNTEFLLPVFYTWRVHEGDDAEILEMAKENTWNIRENGEYRKMEGDEYDDIPSWDMWDLEDLMIMAFNAFVINSEDHPVFINQIKPSIETA